MSDRVKESGRQRIVVAAAQDNDVLLAVDRAARLGIAEPVLVGHRDMILEAADHCGVDPSRYEIINEEDNSEAC